MPHEADHGSTDRPGSLIRDLRHKLGMTQEEFARTIHVTVSTVNRWENGHASPSRLAWGGIEQVARVHGIPCPRAEGTQLLD